MSEGGSVIDNIIATVLQQQANDAAQVGEVEVSANYTVPVTSIPQTNPAQPAGFERSDLANIVDYAKQVGREMYLYVGEIGFRELELSYLLGSLRAFTYADMDTRVRRHVLLMWIRGFYKTSILRSFYRDACGSIEVVTQPDYSNATPTHLWAGDYSRSRLRGSMNETHMALPLLQRPRFLLVSEMLDFIGGMGESEEMINFLNGMLEEGEARVSLNKMVGAQPAPSIVEEMARRGIVFNSMEGIMSYRVESTAVMATRPVPSSLWHKLEVSGFYDRLNVARWHVNRNNYREMWRFVPPHVSTLMPKLRAMNDFIWNAKFHRVNSPPRQMIDDVKNVLDLKYEEVENANRISPENGVRSARDNTNLVQLCTAFALADTLSQQPDNQDGSYERIRYSGSSAAKVVDYVPLYVQSRMRYSPNSGGGGVSAIVNP